MDTIIKHGIKRVYFSIKDPDIRSYNKSSILFKKKGIAVKHGINFSEINYFYRSYFKYKKGKFILGATRGDGQIGENVTSNLNIIKDILSTSVKPERVCCYHIFLGPWLIT